MRERTLQNDEGREIIHFEVRIRDLDLVRMEVDFVQSGMLEVKLWCPLGSRAASAGQSGPSDSST